MEIVVSALELYLVSAYATFPGANGKIAFTGVENDQADVFVINPDGSGQTNISNSPRPDFNADWQAIAAPPHRVW